MHVAFGRVLRYYEPVFVNEKRLFRNSIIIPNLKNKFAFQRL